MFRYLWVLILVLSIAGNIACAATSQCNEYVRDFENGNAASYKIGDAVFKIPFQDTNLSLSQPVTIPTINFYYSMDDHRLFSLRDKKRPPCRGWCNNLLVMISTGHRNNSVAYRIKAIAALSKGVKVEDAYMHVVFETLKDIRRTSYWELLPERRALLKCGPTSVLSPVCNIHFDYSSSVEISIAFGKSHLSESSKILDVITQTLDCLSQEQ